jgi:hypothetical protein
MTTIQEPSFRTIRPVQIQGPYFTETLDSIGQKKSVDKPNDWAYIHTVTSNPMSEAARILGSAKTPRKAKTSRENGKLGGRPKKTKKKAAKR